MFIVFIIRKASSQVYFIGSSQKPFRWAEKCDTRHINWPSKITRVVQIIEEHRTQASSSVLIIPSTSFPKHTELLFSIKIQCLLLSLHILAPKYKNSWCYSNKIVNKDFMSPEVGDIYGMKSNSSFPNIINVSKSKTNENIYFRTINIQYKVCSLSSSFAFTFKTINHCYKSFTLLRKYIYRVISMKEDFYNILVFDI